MLRQDQPKVNSCLRKISLILLRIRWMKLRLKILINGRSKGFQIVVEVFCPILNC